MKYAVPNNEGKKGGEGGHPKKNNDQHQKHDTKRPAKPVFPIPLCVIHTLHRNNAMARKAPHDQTGQSES